MALSADFHSAAFAVAISSLLNRGIPAVSESRTSCTIAGRSACAEKIIPNGKKQKDKREAQTSRAENKTRAAKHGSEGNNEEQQEF